MAKEQNKIAFFIPELSIGGAERVICSLSQEFVQRGYDVDLVLVRKQGEFLEQVPDSVRIVEFPPSKTILSLPYLIKYLIKYKPEILLSTSGTNMAASIVNSVYDFDTKFFLNVANPKSDHTKSKIHNYCIRNYYHKVDQIIAVSDGVKNDLIDNYDTPDKKITVVYNPINVKDIYKKSEIGCGISQKIPTILTAGRIADQKDHSTLIKAFENVLERKDAKLLILGEGKKKQELREQIDDKNLNDHAELVGFVDNPYKYMGSADVFVLSSKFEGLGNVLIEAMACGTPVVSTDCPGGPSEILKSGKYGPLVPVGDHQLLASEIINVLQNPISSEQLKERALDFSTNEIADQFENVFSA